VRDKVVRTPATLQARNELQQYTVDAVRDAGLLPLGVPRVFLALVQQQRLNVIVGDRVAGKVQVPVPESLEYAQATLPAATIKQLVLDVRERHHPRVALHRVLLAVHDDAVLGQQVEPLGLDLHDEVGVRPCELWHRPVGSRPRPHARALERRSDLHHVPVPDPKLHLACVRHHLDRVPVRALITRLRHQRLKPGPDLAGRQVPGSRDELDPQAHAPLAAVAQL